jgi:hypothetical protein
MPTDIPNTVHNSNPPDTVDNKFPNNPVKKFIEEKFLDVLQTARCKSRGADGGVAGLIRAMEAFYFFGSLSTRRVHIAVEVY